MTSILPVKENRRKEREGENRPREIIKEIILIPKV
jgi:hypothetical protein